MASFLRPVGPEPPAVYWRRRILVFGIPLVLVAFIAYACSGSGGSGQHPAAGASSTPSGGSSIITPGAVPTGTLPPINSYPVVGPTSSASAGASGGTGGGGSGSGSGNGGTTGGNGGSGSTGSGGSGGAGGSGSAAGAGVPVGSSGCVLSVQVQLDKSQASGPPTYSAGQNPTFDVILHNTGTGNCLFDVSGKGVVVTVTPVGSGTPAWTTSTCAGKQDMRVLGPGDGYTEPVKWNRQQSVNGCPVNPPTVSPGAYAVTAAVTGVTAASVQFTLQ